MIEIPEFIYDGLYTEYLKNFPAARATELKKSYQKKAYILKNFPAARAT